MTFGMIKIDPDWLRKVYVDELWSYRKIMSHCGFNSARILRRLLAEAGISPRQRSEAVATQWIGNEKRRAQASKNAKKCLKNYWGSPLSPEAIQKISASKRGKNNPMYGVRGPKHHHWLGGKDSWGRGRKIRPDKKKEMIKELGGKCARCGTEQSLTINHKIPWRVVRHHEMCNLEVLCKKCHFSGPNRLR